MNNEQSYKEAFISDTRSLIKQQDFYLEITFSTPKI